MGYRNKPRQVIELEDPGDDSWKAHLCSPVANSPDPITITYSNRRPA